MDVSKLNFIPSVNLSHTEIKEMAKRYRIILNWYIFIFKLDLDSLTCNWNIREKNSLSIYDEEHQRIKEKEKYINSVIIYLSCTYQKLLLTSKVILWQSCPVVYIISNDESN